MHFFLTEIPTVKMPGIPFYKVGSLQKPWLYSQNKRFPSEKPPVSKVILLFGIREKYKSSPESSAESLEGNYFPKQLKVCKVIPQLCDRIHSNYKLY